MYILVQCTSTFKCRNAKSRLVFLIVYTTIYYYILYIRKKAGKCVTHLTDNKSYILKSILHKVVITMSEKISFRVTEFDKQYLEKKATESKTSISHIMRMCMLWGITKMKTVDMRN